ncbi:MAG TPA: two-component regulator propeller domain-containing protein, partial [Thermoanaerobaculia bacterium]
VWDSDSGLPQNSVETILQTSDGYLWLGTQEGLVRSDGVNFTVFDTRNTPAMRDDWVQALCQTRDGVLWIGTLRGLVYRRDGEFRAWDREGPLGRATVQSLYEDRDGSLWVGSSAGVRRIRGLREDPPPFQRALQGERVRAISEDPEGRLWLAVGRTIVRADSSGSLTRFASDEGIEGIAFSVLADRQGHVWASTARGLARESNGTFHRYSADDGLAAGATRVVYEDRGGRIWVGSDEGLFRLSGARFVRYSGPLSSNRIHSIFEDREGSLWVGTMDGGLNRVKEQRIANYTTADGLSDDKIWTVFEDRRGNLWVGAADGGVNRLPAGANRFERIATLGSTVLAIQEDLEGDLWVATRSSGLVRFHGSSRTTYTTADGLAGEWISSLCADRDGSLWIGTGGGLNRLYGGRFTAYRKADGLPADAVFSVFQDRAGDVWVGTIGGGLARFRDGRFQIYTTRDGLAHDTVISIFQDAEGSLWIGTRGGLNRFRDGRFTTFRHKEGLFHDAVQRVLEDGRGFLWLTTNHGIFRVRRAELDAAASRGELLHPVGFSTGNGMHAAECNNGEQGALRTRDGRLWFATLKGLAMADPTRIRLNPVAPNVVVETVLAEGRPLEKSSGLRLPPGTKNLELRYTAFSFRNPMGIHFKYKLEGFDPRWVDAGTRRAAYYTNLPPGRYRFVVLAANEDSVWSERGASSELWIERHLYEKDWFRLSAFVLAAAAVATAHRLRLRRLEARERLRTALVEAQLEALKLQLRPHFLFNTLNSILPLIGKDPAAARRMLVQLGDLLRSSLKRETTQLVTLGEELSFLEQYLDIERTRFRERLKVAIDADREVLSAAVPIFLLQPLVENAVKHGMTESGYGAVRVEARTDGRTLRLSVSDNGPGYGTDARSSPDGIGLKNTRSRLEKLFPGRHVFELSNAPNGGGVVKLEFPLIELSVGS